MHEKCFHRNSQPWDSTKLFLEVCIFLFSKDCSKGINPLKLPKHQVKQESQKNEVSGSYWSPSPSQFSTHPASNIQIVFPHLLIQIKSVHGVSCTACLFSKTLECLWSKATKKWNCLGPLKLYKWVAVKPSVLLHFVKCLYCPFLKGCVVKLLLCGQLEIFDLQKKYFSINGLFGICHFHQKNNWTVCHFIFSLHNFSSCSQKMPLEEKNLLQSKPFVKGQVLTIFQWSSGCIPFFKDHPNHGICNPLRRVWLHLPMSGLAVPTCLNLFPKECGSAKFGQGRARRLQTSTLSWCLDHHQRVLQSLPFCKGRPFPQGLSSWWWSRHLTTLERYPRTSGAPSPLPAAFGSSRSGCKPGSLLPAIFQLLLWQNQRPHWHHWPMCPSNQLQPFCKGGVGLFSKALNWRICFLDCLLSKASSSPWARSASF